MTIKNFHPLFFVLIYAFLFYISHTILFTMSGFNQKAALFKHSNNTLFMLFTTASLFIIAILLGIKVRYFDSVGYAFMALTSIKIGVLLFWAQPILKASTANAKFEKGNFFVLFAVFLAIETIVAIRILNNKQ